MVGIILKGPLMARGHIGGQLTLLTKIDWQQLKFFPFLISFVDYYLLPLE